MIVLWFPATAPLPSGASSARHIAGPAGVSLALHVWGHSQAGRL